MPAVGMAMLLVSCSEENRYVAPPPPKVAVALPLQQPFTPYLEATGNTASINSVKLVARVQGYVQEIKYQDGATVKKGTPLFVIEPEPYKVKLEQAQAAEEGAKAALVNAEAEYQRQLELQAKDVSTQANLDRARANRDTSRANLLQAQANTQTAQINLGYTEVTAPFDGVVTARKVSVGELVGGDQPSELATIVPLDPIWVWFNISERDVQRVRANLAARGESTADLVGRLEVEVGLQTETGFPHKGVLDYADPTVSQSTGTMTVRGIFQNDKRALLPGYFVRVRVPGRPVPALLVPEVAVGSDQGGRYLLVVNGDNVVEQRRVELGQSAGELRVVVSGLKPDEKVVVSGIQEAVPGQKVDPQLKPMKAAEAEPSAPK
ncbi:MAG: efflux RND transporter periplasmic adaptor subunit [Hyphomicrobiales bacterium]|nr:efflux RND transporter periplasmic adaptor subunit [Hyphomicrobiales bacterium]